MALIDQGKSAGKSLGLDLKQFAEAIKGKDQTHDSFSTGARPPFAPRAPQKIKKQARRAGQVHRYSNHALVLNP